MTHAEFVAAYRRGDVKVEIDAKSAARYLSARLLLPLVAMPVLGIGIALALIGWIYTGLALIAVGVVVPRLIKRGAASFLLQQAIEDPKAYDTLVRASIMRLAPLPANPQAPPRANA